MGSGRAPLRHRRREEHPRTGPAGGQARRDGGTVMGVLREGHGDTACDRRGGQAMMRVRRASATGALCLLASAMTACAQCGWVLWEISAPTPKHPDWTYTKVDAEATN